MKPIHLVVIFIVAILLLSVVAAAVYSGILRNQPQSTPTPSASSSPSTSTQTPYFSAEPTPTYSPTQTPASSPTNYSYQVVATFPHDPNAFTEGLVCGDGSLYESTGLYGSSSLRRVNLQTGTVEQIYNLSDEYFGEGITIFNNTIIQLTYQNNIAFLYDKTTFKLLGNFTYPTEGWGLTNDGSQLIMSDGSPNLYFLNPLTYQRTGQVEVHDGNNLIYNLNELEYINGTVFANVWLTNKIAVINPQTGQVQAWIDLTGIEKTVNLNPDSVLNGIAYDQKTNRLFVTGKLWPQLFQIQLVPLP